MYKCKAVIHLVPTMGTKEPYVNLKIETKTEPKQNLSLTSKQKNVLDRSN